VAAILVGVGRRGLDAYLEHAIGANVLWGSLGFIPLFMFWVYVMWLIVLFGLEVTSTLQLLGGRRIEELERKGRTAGLVDPACVMVIMEEVACRFLGSKPATLVDLADAANLPEVTVERLVGELARAGFLHRLEGPEVTVTLARPAEQISAVELMQLGYGLVDGPGRVRRSRIIDRLREGQLALAAQLSLASLVPELAGSGQDPTDR
jgi:membrane protein